MRNKVLNQLAKSIAQQVPGHPLRVGIDGITASGKTRLADELIQPLENLGRPVIRAGSDGFHNPPHVRYRQGRESSLGYYEDSFDYEAMRFHILDPLGPGGSRSYRTSAYDFRKDQPQIASPETAAMNAILLFEGVMLFRPELTDCWDYRVYVDIDFDTSLERAIVRDREHLGTGDAVRQKHLKRFQPGQKTYLDTHQPQHQAHAVIDNHDVCHPTLTIQQI